MSKLEVCPCCRLVIDDRRGAMDVIVCNHCGHVKTDLVQKAEATSLVLGLKALILTSLVMAFGFIEFKTWSYHSPEVRWLQGLDFFGKASTSSYERMAQLCMKLKKHECAESAYAQLGQHDPNYWASLGRLQFSLGKHEEAVQSFSLFMETGQSDLEINYLFAKALAESGRIDQAVDYFELVIKSKPRVLQVTVVQNYVQYLMRASRFVQAEQVIRRMRRFSTSQPNFLESEYRALSLIKKIRG